jgi:hypothetical protein
MENPDTSGFYKLSEGFLICGHNHIFNKDYELHRESKDDYDYPVDGWIWFDSKEDAIQEFGVRAEGMSYETTWNDSDVQPMVEDWLTQFEV